MSGESRKEPLEMESINKAIRETCSRRLGVIDHGFLCQSIGAVNPHSPISVSISDTLKEVVAKLRSMKVGCVLVLDQAGKLAGIFSERDLTLKVGLSGNEHANKAISEFMTAGPQTAHINDPIAYALNLMSAGGFRHLPIVDSDGNAVGIISVKDVVDFIVATLVEDVLNFET